MVVTRPKKNHRASGHSKPIFSRFEILYLFIFSFLGAVAIQLVTRKLVGVYPFGELSGALGDFATQYLPFYSRFRESLVEGNLSNFFFAWDLGLGVSSLPDYATYLGGPWTLIVALFPQEKILFSMTLIVLVKIGLAAGLMRILIYKLRPGLYGAIPFVLSISYSATSWIAEQGQIIPQWLDAVYGIPLLFLAALEMRKPRPKWILGVLSVALVWWSNYYVAYMASLLAGIFAITLAFGLDNVRNAARNVTRFVIVGFLGVILTAPSLLPTLHSLKNGVDFQSPGILETVGISEIFIRLMPLTYDIYSSPMLYSGLFALFLSIAWIFSRGLTKRFKISWGIATLLIFASLVFKPLLTVWNGFQAPHGSIYRWSFVLPAWLIVSASLAIESNPSLPAEERNEVQTKPKTANFVQIAIAIFIPVLVLLTFLISPNSHDITTGASKTIVAFAVATGAVTGLIIFLLPRKGKIVGGAKIALNIVLIGVVGLELVANGVFVGQQFRVRFYSEAEVSTGVEAENLELARQKTDALWPQYRLGFGNKPETEWWMEHNLSARYLYPGTNYYSTTVTSRYVRMPSELGFQTSSAGRFTLMPEDAILQSVVGAANTSELPVLPMVRAYNDDQQPADTIPPIYANRMYLANAPDGYSFPPLNIVQENKPVAGSLQADQTYEVTTNCEIGNVIFAAPTQYVHSAKTPWPIEVQETNGIRTSAHGIFGEIGIADRPSQKTVFSTNTDVLIPGNLDIGCANLDDFRNGLDSVIKPVDIDMNPGAVQAVFDPSISGQVVVATPAVDGWNCRMDGKKVPVSDRSGMLAFDVENAEEVTCEFTTPLFKTGVVVGAIGLIISILLQLRNRS